MNDETDATTGSSTRSRNPHGHYCTVVDTVHIASVAAGVVAAELLLMGIGAQLAATIGAWAAIGTGTSYLVRKILEIE